MSHNKTTTDDKARQGNLLQAKTERRWCLLWLGGEEGLRDEAGAQGLPPCHVRALGCEEQAQAPLGSALLCSLAWRVAQEEFGDWGRRLADDRGFALSEVGSWECFNEQGGSDLVYILVKMSHCCESFGMGRLIFVSRPEVVAAWVRGLQWVLQCGGDRRMGDRLKEG